MSVNDSSTQITVVTSLVPRNIENQRHALSTWQQAGFKVISLNTDQELSLLRPHFPEFEFVVPPRDASKKYHKPYIYFDDVLKYLLKHNSNLCGIINSDIYLLNPDLPDLLFHETPGSLLYGARIDINSFNELPGHMNVWGFDYFFFDKRIVSYYPPEEFCLGLPWWDYWTPLIPVKHKLPVKKIITPVAYHIIHPINYEEKTLLNLGFQLGKYFSPPFELTEQTMPRYGYFLRSLLDGYVKNIRIK